MKKKKEQEVDLSITFLIMMFAVVAFFAYNIGYGRAIDKHILVNGDIKYPDGWMHMTLLVDNTKETDSIPIQYINGSSDDTPRCVQKKVIDDERHPACKEWCNEEGTYNVISRSYSYDYMCDNNCRSTKIVCLQ